MYYSPECKEIEVRSGGSFLSTSGGCVCDGDCEGDDGGMEEGGEV